MAPAVCTIRTMRLIVTGQKKNPRHVTGDIETRLGPDYDVVLEHDHIHVEYDPKT